MGKVNYNIVRELFKENGYELLEDHYANATAKMKVRCDKGHEVEMCWSGFRRGNRCKKCAAKNHSENRRLDHDFVKQYFASFGYTLLDTYENAMKNMKFICDHGHEGKMCWSNFRRGKRCLTCARQKEGERHRLKIDFVKQYFQDHGCKLLENEYKGCLDKMRYICVCGREAITTWSHFKSGHRCIKRPSANNYSATLGKIFDPG